MWPGRVSNTESLTYESGALPTALCGTYMKGAAQGHILPPLTVLFKSIILPGR